MGALTGTGTYTGLILRRDRLWLALLFAFAAFYPFAMTLSILALYPTDAALADAIGEATSNPVQLAMRGQVLGFGVGPLLVWSVTSGTTLILGIASLLLILRHTRSEESTNRSELIGGGPIDRRAALAAALAVVIGLNLLIAMLGTILLIAAGLAPAGSLALMSVLATNAALMAALGAVLAQLTATPAAARNLGLGLLAVFFTLRATADVTRIEWTAWISPFGWTTRVAPYAGDHFWLLLPAIALCAVLIAVAFRICGGRDMGAGLLPQRGGRMEADRNLGSPLALAWRQHRTVVAAWSIGLFLFGLYMAAAITGADQQLGPQLRAYILGIGGDIADEKISDIFLNYLLTWTGFLVGAITIGIASRLRSDETSGSAELVLSTPVSRLRLASSHLVFVILGPALMLLSLGLASGIAYGLMIDGDAFSQVPRVLLASALQVPAAWTMGGITLVLIGFLPRWTMAAWGIWMGFILIDIFSQLHPVTEAFMVIVPFLQAPWVLAGDTAYTPLGLLVLASFALIGGGLLGYQRRGIG